MTSTSSDGSSVIILQFELSLDIDVAEQQVQAAINAATTYLPTDLPNPPIYNKTNPADAPILTLALSSETLPLPKVEDLAETRLAQKIAQQTGVGMVSISGGQKPGVRVRVNPAELLSRGLNLEDLRNAIVAANVNQAKGNFDGRRQAYTIAANDQLLTADQYRKLVIAYRPTGPIMLTDVAQAVDDVENVKQAAWMGLAGENGEKPIFSPAVVMNIQRQPGANIIEVVDRIKRLLPQLQTSLPAAVKVDILTDRTTTIRASVEDVQFELMLTIALVVLVIFLFLRTLSATVIPSVAVPLSLIGTFAVMYMLDFSLNNLTLMALTISTGFVVDDAIVMIENIARYVEQGEKPLQAALKGSAEIGFTIISLSISLIAVLIPLLFMGDIVGRLFREFAVTLSVTILFSAVVSLTLTPMMAARLLSHKPESRQSWFYRTSEHAFESVIAFYGKTLTVVLRHQFLTLMVAVGTLVGTVYLYVIAPKGFFPVQDTGVIMGISDAPQDISFAAMSARQQTLAKAILKDPAVASLSSFIGIDGTNPTLNTGRIQINLKPLDERGIDASSVIRRLQPTLDQIDGISLFMQPVQDLTVETRVSRTQYQYSLEDSRPEELATWAPRFVRKLKELPQLRDVASDQQLEGRQVQVVIDRDTASRLGVTPQLIDNTLYDAFGQRQISIMFTQLNQYRVILEVDPAFRKSPRDLRDIYIATTGGPVTIDGVHGDEGDVRPHHDQSPGAVPRRHRFVQSRARRLAGGCRRLDRAGQERTAHALQHPGGLPGHGGRIPGVVDERTALDPGGARHGVYRPGRPLRKLHPPDHDPLDPAVGRRRGGSFAVDLRHRSGRDRAHRHHSVDWHCQEERDHDDRLRARGGAAAGNEPPRGDLPGVPLAVSSHHDDDDGRSLGRGPAGLGQRSRVRAASAAGHLDHRRPVGLPVAHALHHAGHLPLF